MNELSGHRHVFDLRQNNDRTIFAECNCGKILNSTQIELILSGEGWADGERRNLTLLVAVTTTKKASER